MNKICNKCKSSLYLNDIVNTNWENNTEKFTIKCSVCSFENNIMVNLFNDDGHINLYNLQMLRVDRNYFPKDQFDMLTEHLNNCDYCKMNFENTLLDEIENNLSFNEKTLTFFNKHSLLVMEPIIRNDITVKNKQTDFCIEKVKIYDNEYILNDNDIFHRDKNLVYYYLRKDLCLYGLISFLNEKDNIFIERFWKRSYNSINSEKKFFDDLKNKKIKIDLKTLETIFKRIR